MPYIKKDARPTYDDEIESLIRKGRELLQNKRSGTTNYTISRLVAGILQNERGWDYDSANSALAVFEAAKLEFYRRILVPLEDEKIKENSDIPEYEWKFFQ